MLRRALLLLCLSVLTVLAADITGKWQFDVQTDAGGGSPTFVFKQDGEKLSGTYSGAFGQANIAGTVKGDAVEFSFDAEVGDQKGKIVYRGTIEGPGKMKGEVEFTGLGKGTWTGTKKD